ncbi:MAG: LysE family translocator [Pseudomonadota bacterium]
MNIWVLYVVTVFVLMVTPGPTHFLMFSNSSTHGFRRALSTAMGDISANVVQMIIVGLGMVALVAAWGDAFLVIKWGGVAYLVWLGIRMIRDANARASELDEPRPKVPLYKLWMQGLLTSAANPKEIGFFAAFFPQFITADIEFWPQFLILSGTYIVMDMMFLTAYGLVAVWFAVRFARSHKVWTERIGGCCMIAAAIALAILPP